MIAQTPVAAPGAVCPGCAAVTDQPALLGGSDRMLGSPEYFEVHRCAACGLAFTWPRLQDDDFERFYPPATYTSHAVGTQRDTWLNRARLRHLVQRGPYRRIHGQPAGKLLDVGCGRGELASAFAAEGWRVSGIEPSAPVAERAAERGVDVHTGTLDDAPWASGTFDAVVFNHSLEHVPDPNQALARTAELTREGGLVTVAVPNFGCWQRRVFKSSWFQLDLPRHLQHYDATSLPALMSANGFEVVEVRSSSMAAGLLGSIQYKFLARRRLKGRAFRVAAYATMPLLLVLDRLLGGDCLHVTARRI